MFRSLFVPLKHVLLLFVEFFREVFLKKKLDPHSLQLCCVENKECRKSNGFLALNIAFQRH